VILLLLSYTASLAGLFTPWHSNYYDKACSATHWESATYIFDDNACQLAKTDNLDFAWRLEGLTLVFVLFLAAAFTTGHWFYRKKHALRSARELRKLEGWQLLAFISVGILPCILALAALHAEWAGDWVRTGTWAYLVFTGAAISAAAAIPGQTTRSLEQGESPATGE